MAEEITSALKRKLKTQGRMLDTVMQIGKNGLSQAVLQKVSELLDGRELIKIKVLKSCEFDADTAAAAICEALDAKVVAVTGSTMLLYKASS